MKHIAWIICVISVALWSSTSAATQPKPPAVLVKITKGAFEQGILPVEFYKNRTVKKHNGTLAFEGGCPQLRDIFEHGDYSVEYTYIGDLPVNRKIQVVEKQLLNGRQYVVVDRRLGCKTYLLNGRPYLLKTLLINFNESQTTDLQGTIDFWQIKDNALIHVKKIKLVGNQSAAAVRFSPGGANLLFKDFQGQFWSVALPQ
ncbi:hypothetical protein [Hymenobacter sp. BRD67]|uniref:hypothetical protein n=1 Tax=Hymenobacter sp. BRD67 TaxID=2675877 RepID=UPI0015650FF3|nr:hypothetical protein [Hymenobacter sp. BRD67]QKG53279.1 hypothetical protein GKZ67_12625 [Hymenobacter sp. BRD67]